MTYSTEIRRKRRFTALIGAAAVAADRAPLRRARRGRQRRGRHGRQRQHAAHRRTDHPGCTAKLKNGFAVPPASAPRKVVRAIEAANEIVKGKPYCMGGGHARRVDRCYDCSGSVSYALTGAGLLGCRDAVGVVHGPRWGKGGKGRWITVYANAGHIYAVIAGLRLDTSMTTGDGPGWSTEMRSSSGLRRPPSDPLVGATSTSNRTCAQGPPQWRALSLQGPRSRFRRRPARRHPLRRSRAAAGDLVRCPRPARDGQRRADRDVGTAVRRLGAVRRDRGARRRRRRRRGDRRRDPAQPALRADGDRARPLAARRAAGAGRWSGRR